MRVSDEQEKMPTLSPACLIDCATYVNATGIHMIATTVLQSKLRL